MSELLDILNKVKSGIDYVNEKHLVSDELIDSLDVMTIVTEIAMDVVDVVTKKQKKLKSKRTSKFAWDTN